MFCIYRVGHPSVGALDAEASSRSAFDAFMAKAGSAKVPVSGVGDEAYRIPVNGASQLWTWHHGVKIMIELKHNDPAVQAMLAKVAIGSLDQPK